MSPRSRTAASRRRYRRTLSDKARKFCRGRPLHRRCEGPARGAIEQSSAQNLARIFARAETPCLSGAQIKVPMHLFPDGALVPAIGLPHSYP